jgi:hypothetical protein
MALYSDSQQTRPLPNTISKEGDLGRDYCGNRTLQNCAFGGAATHLHILAFMILVFFLGQGPLYAQPSPPSRPILFVHGICGDATDFNSLISYLSQELDWTLYPSSTVYYPYYDSVAQTVKFLDSSGNWIEDTDVPPNTRFFSIKFYDPIAGSWLPTNVAKISILNKANEIAQVIKHIRAITHVQDVIIVAHSMGGLDARAYVENMASQTVCYDYPNNQPYYQAPQCAPGAGVAAYASDVGDLITVDTPHLGSPLATIASPILSLAGFEDPNLACIANPSTNKTELELSGNGGDGLIENLNYSGSTLAGQRPASNSVPIQAVEDYFSDITTAWDTLSGESDDIVTQPSQSISLNILPSHTTAAITDIQESYLSTDATIANTPACWAAAGSLNLQVLHFMTCLGNLPNTDLAIEQQITAHKQGTLTSATVTATHNGKQWTGTLTFDINGPSNYLDAGFSAPTTFSDLALGTYSISHISGGPSGTATPTIVATPSDTLSLTQWATSFSINFTDKASTTTSLTASPIQVTLGSPLTLSVSVQGGGGSPTGTVTFLDGTQSISSLIALNVNSAASFITTSLGAGTHSITAQYSGDSNYSASTSPPVTVSVTGVSPKISVSPQNGTIGVTSFTKSGIGFTPNKPITHTATWPDNTKSVLNGYADSTGSFSYSVTYSSETGTYYQTDTDNTTGQTSNTVSWIVSPVVTNDFLLTVSPSSQSVLQSSSVGYNIVTTTTSGTAQTVSFGASNLPSGLSAAFSPTSVTSGSQSTLTLTASASAAVGNYTLVIAAASSYTTHTCQISVTVAQTQTGPVLTVTPSIVRFNDQSVGTISSPQTVVLRNSGTGQLIVTGIGLASGNTDYALNLSGFSSPLILNQGVTYSLPVYFEPASAGTRPGQIVIYDNAPGSPQVVSLTGNGLAAQPSTGTINVNATLNGIALPALYFYQYALTGPTSVTGYDNNSFTVTAGSYSIAFQNNPSYFTLSSVTPSATQTLVAGGTATFTLNFTAPNDFYPPSFLTPVGGGWTAQVVPAGSTATYTIGVAAVPNNASSPITLSVFGAPLNSTPVFSPQPVYSGTDDTLTIGTTSGSTAAGVYVLTVRGTNPAGVTHVDPTTSVMAVTAPPAIPVQLISKSNSGAQGNNSSSVSNNSVSADGRYIVFSSYSTNLASGNTSGHAEIYVRDIQSGTTSEASVSTSGVPADSDNYGGGISANGQFVIFYSDADNLYNGSVLNATSGVYVRDLTNSVTEREDVALDGTPANGSSYFGAISADGRYVAFISNATNLVSGVSGTQLYLRDRKASQTSLVSVAIGGSPANGNVSSVSISADGRYVAFVSSATNLVSENTNGLSQVFVRDIKSGVTSLVSISSSEVPANNYVYDDGGSSPPIISADGRYVAFVSYATNLVTQPLDGFTFHGFIYDRQAQQTSLIDVDSVGTPIGAGAGYLLHPAMSLDGRFIAFYDFGQVLVRDIVESQTQVVSLAQNGQPGNNGTYFYNLGIGGSQVAFASVAANLVSNDTNAQADAFVASNPFVGSISVKSISLGSAFIPGGSAVTGTVTLTGAAPNGGAVVSVWSNNTAGQVPGTVTVPAGATSAQFSVNTSMVDAETAMTIMASYNGGSNVAVLTLDPAPELAANPSAWDFGYQAVGTTSAIESFALTNSGTALLAINSVQLATGQVFKISANTCGSSIAAGGGCSVSVTFDPSASGSTSDAVQISYGSPATNFSISLTGNGAIPVAALTPAPLSFGNQSMPGSSTEVATLTNSGNASLSSISASIAGTNAGDFSISFDGCSRVILPANSNCLVTIGFTPKAKGSRQATLSIADSASGSPQTISLTGTGVQSTPTLLWNPSTAAITYGTPLGTGVLDATANQSGSNLAGTFAYTATMNGGTTQPVTQATVLGAGMYTLTASFTPADGTNYTTATATTTLTVNKATSSVTTWPTATSITYGQTLASSTLSGGVSTPAGSFAFTTPTTAPGTGTASHSVTFTPTDATDYSTLTGTASVTVNKANATINVTPYTVTYDGNTHTAGGTATGVGGVNLAADLNLSGTTHTNAGIYASDAWSFTDPSGNYASANGTVSDTINNPLPVISSISPLFTNAGTAFTLTINGLGFTPNSTVYWSTTQLTPLTYSANQLTVQVLATYIPTGGTTVAVTAHTPSPGGGTSNSFQFEVNSSSGSTTGPTFTSTTATVTAGSPASYPVTLPSSVESATVTCLNLPTGAACSYSATTNTLTITTSSTTPKGTYQVTVVFTETVSGTAPGWILLPILLLPLVSIRRKLIARGVWITACLGLILLTAVAYTAGCGGGGGGSSSTPPPQTYQAVSSGTVSITIQ